MSGLATPLHMLEDSDESLFQQFRDDGDSDALGNLMARHQHFAYRVAKAICGNDALAQEAVQEAFVRLIRLKQRFEPRGAGSFRAWLYQVVYRTAKWVSRTERRMKMRQQRYSLEVPAWEPSEEEKGSPELVLKGRLERALSSLQEDLRLTLALHYLAGMTQMEVAQLTGVNQSQVSRRIASGLEALRHRLAALGTSSSIALLPSLLQNTPLYEPPPALAIQLKELCAQSSGIAARIAQDGSRRLAPAAAQAAGAARWWATAAVAAALAFAGAVIWSVQRPGETPDRTVEKESAPIAASPTESATTLNRRWSSEAGTLSHIERVHEGWVIDEKGELILMGNAAGRLLLPVETPARPFKVTVRFLRPGRSLDVGAMWTDGRAIPPRMASALGYSSGPDWTKPITMSFYFSGKYVTSCFADGEAFLVLEFQEAYPCRRVCLVFSPRVAVQEIGVEEVPEQDMPAAARKPEQMLASGRMKKKIPCAALDLFGKVEQDAPPADAAAR